ncbi:MAG: hypothetical protein Athens101428_332 [Candidatus Berkelbacteria bacterium Athens1014_28]|uniref:Uncharacterized protein n=1 Tax=Candidatus Berkelbacteria bacterium Athens1014_28 TaxID=2017145 RepID=A0A554LNT7_9BACT|nr:MAG: hypothetical protein Athens101428_332 [Candidatus Berkelbacteria bacterium Athens1014_28]
MSAIAETSVINNTAAYPEPYRRAGCIRNKGNNMSIFDDLKSIAKVLQEAGKIEQYKQILDAQRDLLEMQKKISDLEKENKQLKEKLQIKAKIIKDKFVYYLENDINKENPFCSRCWEKDKELITLQKNRVGPWDYLCPECENRVEI